MTVWVLLCDEHEQRYVQGVYATSELARNARPVDNETWSQLGPSRWANNCEYGDAREIEAFDVQEETQA